LRFRLWEPLAAITVASVLLAVFRAMGILGAAASFAAAAVFTVWLYPWLYRHSPQRSAAMFDFVWGAVMPVVCLVFDPFVFKSSGMLEGNPIVHLVETGQLGESASFYGYSGPAYAVIGGQLLVLATWLACGRMSPRLTAFWGGMLWAGCLVASFVAISLVVPATFGIPVMGIGALGLIPIFTARAFYRRARQAWSIAEFQLDEYGSLYGYGLLGFLMGFPIRAIAAALFSTATSYAVSH
jgi:hypothetical protein